MVTLNLDVLLITNHFESEFCFQADVLAVLQHTDRNLIQLFEKFDKCVPVCFF